MHVFSGVSTVHSGYSQGDAAELKKINKKKLDAVAYEGIAEEMTPRSDRVEIVTQSFDNHATNIEKFLHAFISSW